MQGLRRLRRFFNPTAKPLPPLPTCRSRSPSRAVRLPDPMSPAACRRASAALSGASSTFTRV